MHSTNTRLAGNAGFTLIELMIVIAIVGILASIAMPSYQDYVRKAKMSGVISSMEGVKKKAIVYYNENGSWPTNNTQVGMDTLTSYATETMDNLYVFSVDGNGQVFSHIVESQFGVTVTSWVRMNMVDENGIIKIDCTGTEGTWPTNPDLAEYIDC